MSRDPQRPAHAVETNAVHGPHAERTGAVSTPIVHSATFSFPSLEEMIAEQAAGPAVSRLPAARPPDHPRGRGAVCRARGLRCRAAVSLRHGGHLDDVPGPAARGRPRGVRGPVLRRNAGAADVGASGLAGTTRSWTCADPKPAGGVPPQHAGAAPGVAHQSHARGDRHSRGRRTGASPRRHGHDRQHHRLAAGPASARAGLRRQRVQRHQVHRRAQRPAGRRGHEARGTSRRSPRSA